jgi:hypothetical protein
MATDLDVVRWLRTHYALNQNARDFAAAIERGDHITDMAKDDVGDFARPTPAAAQAMRERLGANRPEPAPTKNEHPAVWALVIEDVKKQIPDGTVVRALLADMEARDRAGLEKYGVRLQPWNGRDAAVDAYQEALDLVVYLRQLVEEREGSPPLVVAYLTAIDQAMMLRRILGVPA